MFIIFRTHNLIVPDQSVKEIGQTNEKIWLDIKITKDLSQDLEIFGMENLKKDKFDPATIHYSTDNILSETKKGPLFDPKFIFY